MTIQNMRTKMNDFDSEQQFECDLCFRVTRLKKLADLKICYSCYDKDEI